MSGGDVHTHSRDHHRDDDRRSTHGRHGDGVHRNIYDFLHDGDGHVRNHSGHHAPYRKVVNHHSNHLQNHKVHSHLDPRRLMYQRSPFLQGHCLSTS